MKKTIFAILTETGRKPTVFGREYIPDPENPKRSRNPKGKRQSGDAVSPGAHTNVSRHTGKFFTHILTLL